MGMNEYLSEADAAQFLSDRGVPTAPRTLANKRWAGTGPLFVKVGLRVRYRRADLEAYAERMIGQPVRSTAEVARLRIVAK